VRIACERAAQQDLAALTAKVDEAERLFQAGRCDDKIDVHIEFHNLLARATGNTVMVMLMGAVMEVMRDFAHAAGGERNDLTIKARRRLLEALHCRDADGAVAAMIGHLESLRLRYRDQELTFSPDRGRPRPLKLMRRTWRSAVRQEHGSKRQ